MPRGVYEHTHNYERSAPHRERLRNHMLSIRLPPDDPRAHDASVLGGVVATAQRWVCDECSMTSHAAGIGCHQKSSGHSGRTRIDNINEENT